MVVATPTAAPGSDAGRYADLHARYRELYPALAPSFRRLWGRGTATSLAVELREVALGDLAGLACP